MTALYVKIDDEHPERPRLAGPAAAADRLRAGLPGGDAGPARLRSEARWLRYARTHLAGMFPYLPQQPGYNKRLRAALPLIKQVIRTLAARQRLVVRQPLGRRLHPGRVRQSRPTVQALGPGRLGRLRLLRLATPGSSGACACTWCAPRPGCPSCGRWPTRRSDEREVLAAMLRRRARTWSPTGPGMLLIADKGFAAKRSRRHLAEQGIELLRPSRKGEKPRPGEPLLKTGPPAHRVGQRHPQRPARPGTTRRPHLRWRRRPRRPTHPRPGRRDLAQQQDRRTRHPITDRLRPLTGFRNYRRDAERVLPPETDRLNPERCASSRSSSRTRMSRTSRRPSSRPPTTSPPATCTASSRRKASRSPPGPATNPERVRRDLADPAMHTVPVHRIAARWGFTNTPPPSPAFSVSPMAPANRLPATGTSRFGIVAEKSGRGVQPLSSRWIAGDNDIGR